MMTKTVTELLQIDWPLIQAPMSWVTNAQLVAAVSNAGGLGVLGPNAGQTTPATDPQDLAERLTAELTKTQQLTTKPFGINLMLPAAGADLTSTPDTAATLTTALARGVTIFVAMGVPNQVIFAQIKAAGGTIIYRPQTPIVAQMLQAEAWGADILVASGHDQGGYLPEQATGTLTIVPEIVDAVHLPVLAAGGITDRRGVLAAQALGAAGVYLGTRFLATEEAPVATVTKDLIVRATAEDLVMVSPIQRSIATPFARQLAQVYQREGAAANLDARISQAGGLRPAMRLGDLDHGIVTVDAAVGNIHAVQPAGQVVADLMGAWDHGTQSI